MMAWSLLRCCIILQLLDQWQWLMDILWLRSETYKFKRSKGSYIVHINVIKHTNFGLNGLLKSSCLLSKHCLVGLSHFLLCLVCSYMYLFQSHHDPYMHVTFVFQLIFKVTVTPQNIFEGLHFYRQHTFINSLHRLNFSNNLLRTIQFSLIIRKTVQLLCTKTSGNITRLIACIVF